MADRFDEEVERFRKLLAAMVKARGISIRSVERALGAKGGQTRKVLKGDLTLTLRHLLMILDVLKVTPAEFFRTADDPRQAALSDEEWLKALLDDPRLLEPVASELARAFWPGEPGLDSSEDH